MSRLGHTAVSTSTSTSTSAAAAWVGLFTTLLSTTTGMTITGPSWAGKG